MQRGGGGQVEQMRVGLGSSPLTGPAHNPQHAVAFETGATNYRIYRQGTNTKCQTNNEHNLYTPIAVEELAEVTVR